MMGYLISSYMLDENKRLHENGLGGGGYKWSDRLNPLIDNSHFSYVLDFGCGEGTLKPTLNRCEVDEYDPAIPGKDILPDGPYQLIVCCDVLEHVEPELLDNVLESISSRCEFAFFSIATRPSNKTLSDGTNCHLIIEGRDFWEARLNLHFSQVFPEQPIRKNEVAYLCQV